jgi:GT2 family glycosyltransferase
LDTPVRSLPSVAVVSVTYNRCEPLLILLGQLRELDYPADLLDIFLVDNASTDGTVDRVREHFPKVQIIPLSENTGVAGGFNHSIEAALEAPREYDYLWLLDSDAEIEPGTLLPMVEAMQRDERIAVAGSAVYDPMERSRLVTAGLRIDWRKGDIPLFLPDANYPNDLVEVDLIPACSMLAQSNVYRERGLWDVRFPLYWGDTDWCARVKRHGGRVSCQLQSRVWHPDWASVSRGFGGPTFVRDHLRGALLFYLRHDPDGSLRGVRNLMLRIFLRAGLEYLTVRPSFRRGYLAAVRDLLEGRFARDFAAPSGESEPQPLDELVAKLVERLPTNNPTARLGPIPGEDRRDQVREIFERQMPGIRWVEDAPLKRSDKPWSEYRLFHPPELLDLLRRCLSPGRRYDFAICDISTPLLYTLATVRHVVHVDGSLRGVTETPSISDGLLGAIKTLLMGVKTTFVDLPRAIERCDALRSAIDDVDGHAPDAMDYNS